jgi:vacuolar-type H+-ATPase subunit F/Vma7
MLQGYIIDLAGKTSCTINFLGENRFVISLFKKQKVKVQKMSPIYRFLLIGFRAGEEWPNFLTEALLPWGKLDIIQEEALKTIIPDKYNLLIIDAGAVNNVARLVSNLRMEQSKPVLVVTASPTWQTAREILKAGAIDYIGRSFDKKEFRSRIKEILKILSSSTSGESKDI